MTDVAEMSRTERYCRRLDEHLESVHPNERLRFLKNQQIEWIARYDRFCWIVDLGQSPDWGEDATDYVLTIAEIGKRIAREESNG